ncbi:hypothetical protein K8R43_05995 [archaeon]|nr:hypothetical protein [archaeon]
MPKYEPSRELLHKPFQFKTKLLHDQIHKKPISSKPINKAITTIMKFGELHTNPTQQSKIGKTVRSAFLRIKKGARNTKREREHILTELSPEHILSAKRYPGHDFPETRTAFNECKQQLKTAQLLNQTKDITKHLTTEEKNILNQLKIKPKKFSNDLTKVVKWMHNNDYSDELYQSYMHNVIHDIKGNKK